jgi:hypothetical protein
MNNRAMLALALAAGFAGGLASNYLLPGTVHAQAREIPQQVWAHEFVVADQSGAAQEVIGIEKDGKPSMEFLERNGRIRTVRFNDGFASPYVGAGPRNPTLLPIKP